MTKNGKHPRNSLLCQARLDQGWTQQELADKVGTTPVNISRWENGSHFPNPYFRQRLSEVFGKTLAELGLVESSTQTISRITNVPIARNAFFIGREKLLKILRERLSTANSVALTQPQALYGLGGIGKTQTAAEYAFRYGQDYTRVFWIRAATRETLVADYVMLAGQLDLPEKEDQDQQRMVAAVKRWLAANERWLLILDNADDLSLAQDFLPTSHKGHILFTTRAQASGMFASSIEVEKLSVRDGSLLLLWWTKRLNIDTPLDEAEPRDRAAAERVVKKMDGLPLAIVQAGAYIDETGCSLQDYLTFYATHRKDLLSRRSRLLKDHPETVATTWSLSFVRVEQENPASADILRLCAFLAPDAIPEELLTRSASELGPLLEDSAADSFKLNEALGVLRRYSLVQRDGDTHMLSIHRLVQAVQRESMDEQTQRLWAERTVRAVNIAFPKADYSANANHQSYMPHAQECATLITHYQLDFPEAAQLLFQAGDFLYSHSLYSQSQSFHQQALAIREQVLGTEDPLVAESLNALALLSRNQNDYEQAERFHLQALAIREKMLGADHSLTAQSLNNLSVLYRIQGRNEQAEPLLQKALSIHQQSLGFEHPDTLMTLINLAKLYSMQRKYRQAEKLLQHALATGERVLQPGHYLIAHSLNSMARLSFEQRDYEQAEILWKQSLSILEQTFGPEHPVTAERINDLAELAFAQGRYTEAQPLCERALNICEKRLGSQHPDTIAYQEHLNTIKSKIKEEQDSDQPPSP